MSEKGTVADLPDNPFDMPPPYWRSSGVIFQLTSALEDLCTSLRALREVHPRISYLLYEHFNRDPAPPEDDEEFGEIAEPLWEIESRISLKCELAVFMAAIEAEDTINRMSVFNLHKDVSESIEKLSPPEKLSIISASLTGASIKGGQPYELLKALTLWRNAYAHGHCTDRPTKSLRHNHLISPKNYSTIPRAIDHMVNHLEGYLIVSNYLRSISKNDYTSGSSVEDSEIQGYLEQVKKYEFVYDENVEDYHIEYK